MRDESDLIRFEIIGVVRIALCLRGGQSPCHAGGREFESRRSRHKTLKTRGSYVTVIS